MRNTSRRSSPSSCKGCSRKRRRARTRRERMTTRAKDEVRLDCCIAGCGPAGAMLGLLLARAGLRVLVLEKHADFLRDFRGDTIHPSTMEILDELGLAERFLQDLPHTE